MQNVLSAALVQSKQNPKTQPAVYGCSKEIAPAVKNHTTPGIFAIRAALEAIEHSLGSLICHLEDRSTTAQSILGAVACAAIAGRTVKIARRVEDQSVRRIAAVRTTGKRIKKRESLRKRSRRGCTGEQENYGNRFAEMTRPRLSNGS